MKRNVGSSNTGSSYCLAGALELKWIWKKQNKTKPHTHTHHTHTRASTTHLSIHASTSETTRRLGRRGELRLWLRLGFGDLRRFVDLPLGGQRTGGGAFFSGFVRTCVRGRVCVCLEKEIHVGSL